MSSIEYFYDQEVMILGIPDYTSYLKNNLPVGRVVPLLNFLNFLNLKQCNFIQNINERFLDLILTNIECTVEKSQDVLIKEDNYHPELTALLNVTCHSGHNKQKITASHYNFRKANYIDLYQSFADVNWDFLNEFTDVDIACDEFYIKIYELLDKFDPKTKKHNRTYPPWFSVEIINNIKTKHRSWKRYKKQGDLQSLEEFRYLRNQIKYLIDVEYRSYCNKIQNDISKYPNKFWQFINTKRKVSSMGHKNDNLDNQTSIVNAFTNFFQASYNIPES